MGHYYSEMMCQTCGNVRCKCPAPPNTDHLRWINDHDDDFTPITIADFDKKHGTIKTRHGVMPGMPMMLRMRAVEFDTAEEAKMHSFVMMKEEIDHITIKMAADKAREKYLHSLIKARRYTEE